MGVFNWLGLLLVFVLPSSSVVGLSLWVIWARYAKVSGRFLFLRMFGVMGVGIALIWTMLGSLTVSNPYSPEFILKPALTAFLFWASVAGVSLGVIFSVYRQRFGDSL